MFHGEPGWHSEYKEDGDSRFEQSSQLAPESVASRFFSPKMAGTLFVILSYATGRWHAIDHVDPSSSIIVGYTSVQLLRVWDRSLYTDCIRSDV